MNTSKELIVYFPNWKLDCENGMVKDIPWDKVTMVNHAFWKVVPLNETETSFERRKSGLPARSEFGIASTNPVSDEKIFSEYGKYFKEYPDVKIMISLGGWCACGYFSEMAYTEAGRMSFANACVKLIKDNPWIGGIDIDWEYPGGSLNGERGPVGDENEGCPIWGNKDEDKENFTLLLKALKESLDENFGEGKKLVTACAGAPLAVIKNQDWKKASEWLDFINIMSYDLTGEYDGVAGHASSVSGAKLAMNYLTDAGVLRSKINIGAPFYGTGFNLLEDADTKNVPGTKTLTTTDIVKEKLTVPFLMNIEKEAKPEGIPGWHLGYDEINGAAYAYNDDSESREYRWYISYDNETVLKEKIKLVYDSEIAGIIVWEITQDSLDHRFTEVLATK